MDKKITVDGASDVVSKTFSFCVQCVMEVKDLPAVTVATESLRPHAKSQQQHKRRSGHGDVAAETLPKSPVGQIHQQCSVKIAT